MRRLKTIAVIGTGLIGGSFALAMRRAGAVAKIVGFDRDPEALERATVLGIVDAAAESVSEVASNADLVFIAVPVRAVGPVLHDVALRLGPDAVITDSGSTKADIVRTATTELRARMASFVPGHPIAGREASGVDAATADLFRDARVVLTPEPSTLPAATSLVRTCWEACGARVTEMSAQAHDHTFAAVSHLPHVLAFALVSEILSRSDASDLLSFAAGGFRDFTRIAASSPEMWRDITLANRDALLEELDSYTARLAVFRELVKTGDGPGLQRLMAEARNGRRALGGGKRSASEE